MLYKFTPELDIAKKISIGIFRFYELTKYIKIEDKVGRSDPAECSVSFPPKEYENFPEKLPIGSFRGVEFKCITTGCDEEYIKQYFVFCMSTEMNSDTIGDSKYVVELQRDNFECFMQFLNPEKEDHKNQEGTYFFSHGEVEYYNIHNHPKPLIGSRWREVFLKHSDFTYQNEYRAAFFVSDSFFERTSERPDIIEYKIFTKDKKPMGFNLKICLSSGIDDEGWRYVELDVSEFASNISSETSKITELV